MHIRGGLPRWLPSNTPRLTVIREDLQPQSLADSKASHWVTSAHVQLQRAASPTTLRRSGGV